MPYSSCMKSFTKKFWWLILAGHMSHTSIAAIVDLLDDGPGLRVTEFLVWKKNSRGLTDTNIPNHNTSAISAITRIIQSLLSTDWTAIWPH